MRCATVIRNAQPRASTRVGGRGWQGKYRDRRNRVNSQPSASYLPTQSFVTRASFVGKYEKVLESDLTAELQRETRSNCIPFSLRPSRSSVESISRSRAIVLNCLPHPGKFLGKLLIYSASEPDPQLQSLRSPSLFSIAPPPPPSRPAPLIY